MHQLGTSKILCAILLFSAVFCMAAGTAALAQTFSTLMNFDGENGYGPEAALIQGADGNFYGTTTYGGIYNKLCASEDVGCGTLFKVTPDGALTTLHQFCSQTDCADGFWPSSKLIQAVNGDLYGVTYFGGTKPANCTGDFGCGTIFKISPTGDLTTLHPFVSEPNQGYFPSSGLVQGPNGNFFGTAFSGGANGGGTVFMLTPGGSLTSVYSFSCGQSCVHGSEPSGALTLGTDGNFYGASSGGITNSACPGYCGTLFRIAPSGALTTLYLFTGKEEVPNGGLVEGPNGIFFGTTVLGGSTSNVNCAPFGCGTVFQIGADGKPAILHNFCASGNCPDGSSPGPLILATDGNFYGTTTLGGTSGYGTVFKITPAGALTTLHNFTEAEGIYPNSLFQATNGDFYGTTNAGGTSTHCSGGCGTVFRLSVGLAPFIKAQPTLGNVGQQIVLLGNNLTGATGVTFNGKSAAFTVDSSSSITATVPAGATTGTIEVVTPSGTLAANTEFYVRPQIFSFSPASGPPGTSVVITGQSFTQATMVLLNCQWPMDFTVDSDTQITATIPANATSGEIGVQTRGGHVDSVATFSVTP
jgi:uncharacterized repeat protein (TIGR03803 family)